MNSKKKYTIAILTWVFFVAILLLGLEIFARFKLGYKITGLKLDKGSYFKMDKTKIWNIKFIEENKSYFKNWPIPIETFEATRSAPMYVFKPGLRMASVNGKLISARPNDQVFWSSGMLGFRGEDFNLEKSSDIIRIVTLGASTTEGSQSDNETYPFYLKGKLKEGGYNIEIINAGHHGYNINDLLVLFEEKVLPLKPDVVILYEVSNNTNPSQWLLDEWGGWYSWELGYGKVFRILRQNSAIFVFLTKSLGFENRQPPIIQHKFSSDSKKPSQKIFEEKVSKIIDLAKENHIKIVLTTFVTVTKENLEVDKKDHKSLWEDLYLKWYPFTPGEIALIYDNFNESLKDVAASKNVPIIDLASEFPKNTHYFVDHIHFTPEGNQLLAKYIADYLIRNVLAANGR